MTTIATHSGSHHADDVVGVAILMRLYPRARLLRTRDPESISQANFAVDVGGAWAPYRGRFDHHQKGFAGARASGVVFASAGLVWDAHGRNFLLSLYPDLSADDLDLLHQRIDDDLVQHVDMADTGAAAGAAGRFGFSMLIDAYNVTREEIEAAAVPNTPERRAFIFESRSYDNFMQAVRHAGVLLERCAAHAYNAMRSRALVLEAEQLGNGRILVLPAAGLDWIPVVCESMPDVLFVVYPDTTDAQHQVRTVPVTAESFTARCDLPVAWAGLRDADLAKATSVADAVFCHNARFICGAASKQGAIALATLALEASRG